MKSEIIGALHDPKAQADCAEFFMRVQILSGLMGKYFDLMTNPAPSYGQDAWEMRKAIASGLREHIAELAAQAIPMGNRLHTDLLRFDAGFKTSAFTH